MRKKMTLLIVSLLICLSMAACGGKAESHGFQDTGTVNKDSVQEQKQEKPKEEEDISDKISEKISNDKDGKSQKEYRI